MRLSVALSLLLLLPISLCLSCRSGKTVAEELELTKQAGLPTTPKELQPPLPPADRNAAIIYRQLTELMQEHPLSEEDKIAGAGVSRKELPSDQIAALRRAYSRRGDVGNLIYQAVSREACVFKRPWETGPDVKLPEYANMRLAARWLSGESAVLLHDGKTQQAIETQALGFRIARHASNDPILIAQLVAIAIDAISLAGMERILYTAGDRPEIAQAVQQAIEKEWKPVSMAYGMHGEIIMDEVIIGRLRKSGPAELAKLIQSNDQGGSTQSAPQIPDMSQENWERFLNDNGVVLFETWRAAIADADKPYPEAAKTMHALESDLDSHEKEKDMRYL
ncbi:MAG TPA: hypothetical protein VKU00_02805, partial [Chthonomonadaceae bacterium]|nr:hypothetical protein [Chthonomonadaceae bacterium]